MLFCVHELASDAKLCNDVRGEISTKISIIKLIPCTLSRRLVCNAHYRSKWMVSDGTARKVPLHILKFLAYRRNIYPPPPHPIFSPTTSHISPVSSFLPSFLSYSRFLALAVSHPTARVAIVFFKDLSRGSSSGDYSFTTRVCLSSLSRVMTWNEGFLPEGRFESFLPLVAP